MPRSGPGRPPAGVRGTTPTGPSQADRMLTRRFLLQQLLAAALVVMLPLAALAQSARITFLHTNDVYEITPARGWGGFAPLMTMLREQRAAAPNTITTFGGDLISPSIMSGLLRGS